MPTVKKPPAKAAPTKKAPVAKNAVQLLINDHREVKALFEQYGKLADGDADGQERKAVAQDICNMLTVHATIEEEIFYPAARAALDEDDAEDLLDEAEVEHASAKDLIAQIMDMEPEDDLYDAKVKVLGEYIDHHVQEEEGEMFPKAKASEMDLTELGAQLQQRKAELMAEITEGAES